MAKNSSETPSDTDSATASADEENSSDGPEFLFFCEACGQGFEKDGACPDCGKPLVKAPENLETLETDPNEVAPETGTPVAPENEQNEDPDSSTD